MYLILFEYRSDVVDFDRITFLGMLNPTHTGLSAFSVGLPQKLSVQSVAGSQILDRRSSRTPSRDWSNICQIV